jgi:hypothetical protein
VSKEGRLLQARMLRANMALNDHDGRLGKLLNLWKSVDDMKPSKSMPVSW